MEVINKDDLIGKEKIVCPTSKKYTYPFQMSIGHLQKMMVN